ncbi:MAG TPA: HigA family addiction module antitoxin [Streptosporangiaceae bacterium]|jgi:transcriptional regulator with XRE-family HTH domain
MADLLRLDRCGINEIVHGQRRISADTALRLARYFGTSERFWMNLQARYDLEIEKDRLGAVEASRFGGKPIRTAGSASDRGQEAARQQASMYKSRDLLIRPSGSQVGSHLWPLS